MEEKVEISMEVLTFLERKNKHNYRNGFKFQFLPLNFPLNILVKITIFYNLTHVKHRITNQTKDFLKEFIHEQQDS